MTGTRDGTAEPVSRVQILKRERGQGKINFPSPAADIEKDRIGNLITRLICIYACIFDHTYSKSMDQPGKVANPARGQLNKGKKIPVRVRA